MNVFANLKSLLNKEILSKKEFEIFKSENLEDWKSLNDIGLAYLISLIEKTFGDKDYISSSEIKSNATLIGFLREPNQSETKKKVQVNSKKQIQNTSKKQKKKKFKLPKILRPSKRKTNEVSKSEINNLKRAKGIVEKTKSQLKAEELNKARQNQIKSPQTTTQSSIWTVKKK